MKVANLTKFTGKIITTKIQVIVRQIIFTFLLSRWPKQLARVGKGVPVADEYTVLFKMNIPPDKSEM